MKIAANLHLLDRESYQPNIPDRHVISAIGIANELLDGNLKLCIDKGIVGVKAEFTAVINYLTKTSGSRSERDLTNSLRRSQPFKDYTGNTNSLIKQTLGEMVNQGLLIGSVESTGKVNYSLRQ